MKIKQNGLWVNPPTNIQWRLNNQWHQVSDSSIYKLATDEDFSGFADGEFIYDGAEEYVEIPHIIKLRAITTYNGMFQGSSTIKGVKSTNANVTEIAGMFQNSQSTELDLSELNLSSVTNANLMFRNARIEKLDLSNFDTSSTMFKWLMFTGATIGTIYARTQVDADFFRSDTGLSTSTNVIVK